jgi:PAS domain S-box-containing protein
MPRALALPSPSQYLELRTALTSEIEHRQQVSEVLADTEQRYELLIESVTDYAIFSMDPHGVVRDWNKGAERIKGYRAEEVIGRHFSMFYTPEDRDRGRSVLHTAIMSRNVNWVLDADIRSFSSAPHFGREFQKELNTLSRFAGGVLLRC